jgi:hypothetical protein
VRYWVVLEPPASVAGVEGPVRAVELEAAQDSPCTPGPVDARASYLGEGFEVLATRRVVSFAKREAEELPESFRRGDANADGTLNLADAIGVLEYLFLRGQAPPCGKAADADDDGRLTVLDTVTLVLHLFGGRETLPEPFRACGADPSADRLGCESFPPCE